MVEAVGGRVGFGTWAGFAGGGSPVVMPLPDAATTKPYPVVRFKLSGVVI